LRRTSASSGSPFPLFFFFFFFCLFNKDDDSSHMMFFVFLQVACTETALSESFAFFSSESLFFSGNAARKQVRSRAGCGSSLGYLVVHSSRSDLDLPPASDRPKTPHCWFASVHLSSANPPSSCRLNPLPVTKPLSCVPFRHRSYFSLKVQIRGG